MRKNVFQPYIDTIDAALKAGKQRSSITKSFGTTLNDIGPTAMHETARSLPKYTKEKDKELFDSLAALGILSGVNAKYHETLGAHPDFAHLKVSNSTEQHYIVSMFIDIKNSTGMFEQYYPDTVANVTTTIQRLAIHVCWYFGGYVQRLHGDGLLAYFGGKSMTVAKASENAVNAASVFSYFMKTYLKGLFDQQGIKNISTRIGIDTGDAIDILWHAAGTGECSEVTTCSLHTSLAFKMQSSASLNGIIVGDNIKKYLPSYPQSLFTHKKYKTEDGESEYIYVIPAEGFQYKQWAFDWYKHLLSLQNVDEDNGQLYFNSNAPIVTKPNAPTASQRDMAALERLASKNTPWSM